MSNLDEQHWDNIVYLTGVYQVDAPFMRNIVVEMSETRDVVSESAE